MGGIVGLIVTMVSLVKHADSKRTTTLHDIHTNQFIKISLTNLIASHAESPIAVANIAHFAPVPVPSPCRISEYNKVIYYKEYAVRTSTLETNVFNGWTNIFHVMIPTNVPAAIDYVLTYSTGSFPVFKVHNQIPLPAPTNRNWECIKDWNIVYNNAVWVEEAR